MLCYKTIKITVLYKSEINETLGTIVWLEMLKVLNLVLMVVALSTTIAFADKYKKIKRGYPKYFTNLENCCDLPKSIHIDDSSNLCEEKTDFLSKNEADIVNKQFIDDHSELNYRSIDYFFFHRLD